MTRHVTESDILAAVVAAAAPPPDDLGVSITEYAAAEHVAPSVAEWRLEAAVKDGRLLKGWARRIWPSGEYRRVRVYRPARGETKA